MGRAVREAGACAAWVAFLGFEQFQVVFRKASCPAPTNWVDAVRSQPGFQVPHRPLQAKRRLAKGQVAAGNHVVASVPAVLPLRCATNTDATPAAHRTVSSWARDVPVNLFSETLQHQLAQPMPEQRDDRRSASRIEARWMRRQVS
jgi:hypothetical protein